MINLDFFPFPFLFFVFFLLFWNRILMIIHYKYATWRRKKAHNTKYSLWHAAKVGGMGGDGEEGNKVLMSDLVPAVMVLLVISITCALCYCSVEEFSLGYWGSRDGSVGCADAWHPHGRPRSGWDAHPAGAGQALWDAEKFLRWAVWGVR